MKRSMQYSATKIFVAPLPGFTLSGKIHRVVPQRNKKYTIIVVVAVVYNNISAIIVLMLIDGSVSLLEQLANVLVLLLHPPVGATGLVVQPVDQLVVLLQLLVQAGGKALQPRKPKGHLLLRKLNEQI